MAGEVFIYYEFDDFRLDVENEKLFKADQPVLLTQKAFAILHLLLKNSGQLVKKDFLISEIWQDSFVEDANITQQIYILRKTLGNDKNGKPFIETLPKRGYSFVGEVKKHEKIANESVKKTSRNEAVENDVSEEKPISLANDKLAEKSEFSTVSKATPKKYLQIGSVVFAVFVLFGAVFFFKNKASTASGNAINSVAVLPFKNISRNDDSKLAFGLSDAVINNLSKQHKIPVRSMSSVFQYADKESYDPIEAGKNLGVDSVLEGTVQRDGEEVRVSLRLIKISDGSTLWAETFNERSGNIFALQDSISDKVARSLPLNLSGWEKPLVAKQPANPEAFQFYRLGVYFSNTHTKEGFEKAVLYFQKAIELDPNYAPAYAMLADTYNWQNGSETTEKSPELWSKSEEAAKKALALDDAVAEAYIALAFVQFAKYKDFEAGKNSLERAVRLAPFNPFARLHYGWELLQRGDVENAYQELKLAQEYAPLSAHNNMSFCSILICKRDYRQALKYCEKAAQLQPTLPFINIQTANVLYLNGRTDEAVNLLKLESKDVSQKFSALGSLAYIYAKSGNITEAENLYSQIKDSPEEATKYSDLTVLAFTLGKKDEALKYFRQMLNQSAIPPTYLNFDPYWEEVLKDENFKTLIGRTPNQPA